MRVRIRGNVTRLKQAMLDRNIIQSELAQKLGCKQNTISDYVNEKVAIPSDKLKQICIALNVSSDYILGLSNEFDAQKKMN